MSAPTEGVRSRARGSATSPRTGRAALLAVGAPLRSEARATRGWGASPGSERGSGTLLMVGVLTVVLALSVTATCIAGYLVAAHHARAAADLAALSGAAAYAGGAEPCGAADRDAHANRATVVTCSQVGDPVDFVVSVQVEVRLGVRVAGLPTRLRAVAYAGAES